MADTKDTKQENPQQSMGVNFLLYGVVGILVLIGSFKIMSAVIGK